MKATSTDVLENRLRITSRAGQGNSPFFLCNAKYLTPGPARSYLESHESRKGSIDQRTSARQSQIHPGDNGARRIVYRCARLGWNPDGSERSAHRARLEPPAIERSLVCGLAGRS